MSNIRNSAKQLDIFLDQEVWKDAVGYEGLYQISSCGAVKSMERFTNNQYGEEFIMRQQHDRRGYKVIQLRKDRKYKLCKVHRLVAIAFIPNPENKPQVNHKNGIKADNRVENLEWATSQENVIHSHKNGLCSYKYGEKCHLAKLKKKEVLEIREKYATGNFTYTALSNLYGIGRIQITRIVHRERWKHI